MTDAPAAEEQLAVIALDLLQPMTKVDHATRELRGAVADTRDCEHVRLLDLIIAQSGRVIDVLRDLVRSGNPEIVAALDALRRESG